MGLSAEVTFFVPQIGKTWEALGITIRNVGLFPLFGVVPNNCEVLEQKWELYLLDLMFPLCPPRSGVPILEVF